jgi:hypothetical protein
MNTLCWAIAFKIQTPPVEDLSFVTPPLNNLDFYRTPEEFQSENVEPMKNS